MGPAPSQVCENQAKMVVSRCLSQFFNTLLSQYAQTQSDAITSAQSAFVERCCAKEGYLVSAFKNL
jgi:hypothetical protein